MRERVAAELRRLPPASRLWIAYSGGLDSHVLLDIVACFQASMPALPTLYVVHVHHGLQAEADHWTLHCQTVCDALGLPLTVVRVDARSGPGESPEEVARRQRYQAIKSLLEVGDIVLTAQHEDDQAETLMLQLLRGAGLAGLAGMPHLADLGGGKIARPLLQVSRQDLEHYAREQGLRWIKDPSNGDDRFDRNFLRRRIMPLLRTRWPSASRALARTAGHCGEAHRQLVDLTADLYASTLNSDGTLSVSRLRQLQAADQRLVLREWLRHSGYRMPSSRTLERVVREAIPAATGKNPVIAWREGEIRRYRDSLLAMPPSTGAVPIPRETIPWTNETTLDLPSRLGVLHALPAQGTGLDPAIWHNNPREVRFRSGGEKCRLPGRQGQHCLKKLFQERGIPPWQRPEIPLIYLNGELAAVGDLWTCAPYTITDAAVAIVIRWDR